MSKAHLHREEPRAPLQSRQLLIVSPSLFSPFLLVSGKQKRDISLAPPFALSTLPYPTLPYPGKKPETSGRSKPLKILSLNSFLI